MERTRPISKETDRKVFISHQSRQTYVDVEKTFIYLYLYLACKQMLPAKQKE